jgi:hypothetical protein
MPASFTHSPQGSGWRPGARHLPHPSGKGEDLTSAAPETRELAARESNGVHVVLLWHPRADALTVSVDDAQAGQRFRFAVAPDRALDAFYHPFAYAAPPG